MPDTSTTTLPAPSGNLVKKSVFTYDTFSYSYRGSNYTGRRGKLMEQDDYAFGSGAAGALAAKTVLTYLDDSNGAYTAKNIVNRVNNIQRQDASSNKLSETRITYDSTALTNILGVTHHDDTNFGTGNTTRGNPTLIERWITGTTYASTTLTYDITGQLRQATDARAHATTFSYTDAYYKDDNADPPGTYAPGVTTNAYVTQVTLPSTGGISHVSSGGYYYPTGKPAKSTDENGQTTYFHFFDTLDRQTRTKFPDSGWILNSYNLPSGGTTLMDSYVGLTDATPSTSCTGCRHDQATLDSLGRLTRSTLVSDPQGADHVDAGYDTSGRVSSISNPYRSTSNGSDTLGYDGLGRTTSVTHTDGSVAHTYYGAAVTTPGGRTSQICSSATYGLGYPILTVDESGNRRQMWIDGLGRLIETDEPDSSGSLTSFNALNTCYTYDVLGNLLTAVQGGQTRTFTYDRLSRMLSATNPESGTICYGTYVNSVCTSGYDGNGNLTNRTDARGVVVAAAYDELNRITSRSYSDGTPTVYYAYDVSTNGKPRLYSMAAQTGPSNVIRYTYASYDALGRPTASSLYNDGPTYGFSYGYDLAGNLTSETLPSGHNIAPAYDTASRVSSIGGTKTYASSVTYAPFGATAQFQLGNSLWEQTTFNNRLQPTAIKLGTTAGGSQRFSLGLDYGTTGNNGNLRSQAINTISATQYYAYDSLNRLKAAAENPGDSQPNCPSALGSTWCEAYGYDRYGNRWVSYSSGIAQSSLLTPNSAAWFNSANNRFAATYGSYDLAGNLTGMAGWSFQYDGDNHQKQASINGWAGSVFTYLNGPDGRRVSKSVYGNTDVYVYDAFGQLAAEYQNSALLKEFVYLNGKLLAVELAAWRGRPASTEYVTTDHLGSARVLTSATGAVLSRHDYLPFGKETPLGGARTPAGGYISPEQERVLQRFIGDELDPETGLGYFINRYYSGRQGRFTSPDPLGILSAHLSNPQSLNQYSYVLGNPLLYTDPLGLAWYVGADGCSYHVTIVETSDPNGNGNIKVTVTVDAVFCPSSTGGSDGANPGTPPSRTPGGPGGPGPGAVSTIKSAVCAAIPEGRVAGGSVGVGGIGATVGGGEILYNYNTGETSGFVFGGFQVGWNGVVSGSAYGAIVRNLGESNTNYSGPFTGANASIAIPGIPVALGVMGAATSRGIDKPLAIDRSGAQTFGFSASLSLVGTVGGGVSTTKYSPPRPLGNFARSPTVPGVSLLDYGFFVLRQICR